MLLWAAAKKRIWRRKTMGSKKKPRYPPKPTTGFGGVRSTPKPPMTRRTRPENLSSSFDSPVVRTMPRNPADESRLRAICRDPSPDSSRTSTRKGLREWSESLRPERQSGGLQTSWRRGRRSAGGSLIMKTIEIYTTFRSIFRFTIQIENRLNKQVFIKRQKSRVQQVLTCHMNSMGNRQRIPAFKTAYSSILPTSFG